MKILYVGAGEGGTVVVDRLSKTFKDKENYSFKVINSSGNDALKATNIKKEDSHLLKNVSGLAKKMEKVAELIQEQGQEILTNVFLPAIENEVTHIVLVATTGGGTGCGMVTQLARILKENLEDIKLRVIFVTPFKTEDARSFRNTSIAVNAMEELKIPVRMIGNGNYENYEGRTKQDIHDSINKYIVETEYLVLEADTFKPLGLNTDKGEIDTVLFEPGYQFIARVKLSVKDKEKNTKEILHKLSTSLDLGYNKDGFTYMLTILQATSEIAAKLNLTEIKNSLGTPKESSFETHIAPTIDNYLTIVLSGCYSYPASLQEFYEAALRHHEEIEKLEKKTLDFDFSKFQKIEKEEEKVTNSVFSFLDTIKETKKENKEVLEKKRNIDISKWKL